MRTAARLPLSLLALLTAVGCRARDDSAARESAAPAATPLDSAAATAPSASLTDSPAVGAGHGSTSTARASGRAPARASERQRRRAPVPASEPRRDTTRPTQQPLDPDILRRTRGLPPPEERRPRDTGQVTPVPPAER